MSRKLFCEINPVCYDISVFKERTKRNIRNQFNSGILAKTRISEELPNIVKSHTSIIMRKLYNVDMQLQMNKKTNLTIAAKKINGIIIKPGEIFSFWYLVGNITKKEGYLDGLVISSKA